MWRLVLLFRLSIVLSALLLLSRGCQAEDAAASSAWGVPPEGGSLRFGEVAVEPFDVNDAVLSLMKWLTDKGVLGLEPNTSALEPYLYLPPSVGGGDGSSEGDDAEGGALSEASGNRSCMWDDSGESPNEGAKWLRPELAIRSKQDLEEESTIMLFPNSVLLSADKIATWEPHLLPYDVDADGCFWTSYTVVAAWLLRERAKGRSSFWHLFIRLLPGFVHTPLLFSKEAFNATECDRLKDLADYVEQGVTSEYAKCRPETVANASLSDFVWAMSMVASRCFSSNGTLPRNALVRGKGSTLGSGGRAAPQGPVLPPPAAPSASLEKSQGGGEVGGENEGGGLGALSEDSGPEERGHGDETGVVPVAEEEKKEEEEEESRFEQGVMLLPYGDLLNHEMEPNSYWEVYRGEFIISADNAPIPRGAEVTLSYGGKSSEEYLMAYGFLPTRNPHDYIFLFDDVNEVLDFFAAPVLPGGRFLGEEQQGGEEEEVKQVGHKGGELGKQEGEGHEGGEGGQTEGGQGEGGTPEDGDGKEGEEAEGLVGSRAWAVAIVRRAEERVQAEVEKGDWKVLQERFHTLFGESAVDSYLGWVGGRVEPRLLAILSALWFQWNHTTADVDYGSLANATMVLGMGFETDINCEQLEADALIQAGMGEALGRAAQMVRRRTQQKLRAMKSSAEEDSTYLQLLRFCRGVVERELREAHRARRGCASVEERAEARREGAQVPGSGDEQGEGLSGGEGLGSRVQPEIEGEGKGKGGGKGEKEGDRALQGGECTPFIRGHLKELEVLVTLQMRKKEILTEVKDRMAWTCDPAYEPFRQVILHGADLELPDEDDIE